MTTCLYLSLQNSGAARRLLSFAVCLAIGTRAASAAEPVDQKVPKVILIGDSIRLSYADEVAKLLAGKAQIVSPPANGGDSGNVLKHLQAWVIQEKPDVVHFNCGIHDTKKSRQTGAFQVPPDQYAVHLRKIVEQIRQETGARVLFATSTPILDERARQTRSDRDYELLDGSIRQYNDIATKVMLELSVPIDDLNRVISRADPPDSMADLISGDGVHLTPRGQELAGQAVAQFILAHLPPPR